MNLVHWAFHPNEWTHQTASRCIQSFCIVHPVMPPTYHSTVFIWLW